MPEWRKRTSPARAVAVVLTAWLTSWSGCSSTRVAPLPALPDDPPTYTQVPHPQGLEIGDLYAIFAEKGAPSPETFRGCERDLRTLREKTHGKDELQQGVRELVTRDPVRMHWCFYSQFVELESSLQTAAYLDERQKIVLDTYVFATPVARAFLEEFKDTRYLRWAVSRYRRLSEFVFYRRLELSPQGAAELIGALNPWTNYRKPVDQPTSVLEKYGVVTQPNVTPSTSLEGIRQEVAAEPQAPNALPEPPAQAAEQANSLPPPASPDRLPATEPGSPPDAELDRTLNPNELDPPDLSTTEPKS